MMGMVAQRIGCASLLWWHQRECFGSALSGHRQCCRRVGLVADRLAFNGLLRSAPRPPRPGATAGALGLPVPPRPGNAASGAAGTASQAPATSEPSSLAVATAQLPPPNPRPSLAPSGQPPRQPTAAGSLRLAPGQVAFASGRSGTPLPKFGPLVPAGQAPAAAGAGATGAAPGGFRPLVAGSVGAKRQRESPAASPLMSSGIRNLSGVLDWVPLTPADQ